MSAHTVPVLKRSTPRLFLYLAAIPFYLVLVPFNWLFKVIGKPSAFMRFVGSKQFKPDKLQQVFQHYNPDAGDIFVCTFSKSGTNWMMQIAHQIAWLGEGEYANIHDVVSWPDVPGKRRDKLSPPLQSGLIKTLSPTAMRVIKTHLAAEHVPYSEKAKYITVVRDPKEVFVSSYPFIRGIAGPLMPYPDVWLELFMTREWPMNFGNTWAEHAAGYWAMKDRPNVLVLSYSQLKRDPESGIRQVAETLGITLTTAQLARVMEKSSFAYMKAIDHKFIPTSAAALPWSRGLSMIREGKTGNSSELITPEQQQRIDEHFRRELNALNSDFPYDDFFK